MKKLLLGILLLLFLFVLVKTVSAAVSVGNQQKFEQRLGNPVLNKETFDFQSVWGTIGSLNTLILGCSDDPIKFVGQGSQAPSNASSCPKELQASAVGGMGNMIASLYSNPPVSGTQYLAYVIGNLGLAKPAYAQTGAGFGALSPVLPLWRAFRNITYVFFVILFVAIGFAIMFRVKISPQAVVTIQSALPKVIIALLLVTFSYAIAGFMIDLIYIFLALFIQFLSSQGLVGQPQGVINQYMSGGFLGLLGGLFAGGLGAWNELLSAFLPAVDVVGATIGAILGAPGGALGIIGGAFLGILGSRAAATVIIMLLIAIALLYALVRIFLVLLISYVSIIFLTIFGPLMILFDALPMQTGMGTGVWFRNLFANIIVFPVTAILIIVGTILTASTDFEWVPPMLPHASGRAIQALLGLGILLFVAQIINKIKYAMQAVNFERELEGPAKFAQGVVNAPGEELLRREAYEHRGNALMGAIWTAGSRLRRWTPNP